MNWLNEPPVWREDDGVLFVTTGDRTDFWRKTHYGFIRDDGHFRYRQAEGDLSAEITFSGNYRELYDQAGMMLRIDERNWLKAGVEYVAGRQMLSVVVTRDASDWSTTPAPVDAEWLRLRLTRQGGAVRVEWAVDGKEPHYDLLRLTDFPTVAAVSVGPMCCSPQRQGFEARFRNFTCSEPVSTPLHG